MNYADPGTGGGPAVAVPTVSEVSAWKTGTLDTDAASVSSLASQLDREVLELSRARTAMRQAWGGPAADAAFPALTSHVKTGEDLTETLEEVKRTLRRGAERLEGAQSAVADAVRDATADGCKVADDGTASPPSVPAVTYPADDPAAGARAQDEYDAAVKKAQDIADGHTAAIKGALKAAARIDQLVAASLTNIELPDALAKPAYAAVQVVVGVAGGEPSGDLPVKFPSGWRPRNAFREISAADWVRLVSGGGSVPTYPMTFGTDYDKAEAFNGYLGAGAIVGPDGKEYPLVIPQIQRGQNTYTADAFPTDDPVTDLGGKDPGWRLVGHHEGTGVLNPPDRSTTGFTRLGGAAGGSYTAGVYGARRHDLEAKIGITSSGWPFLKPHPDYMDGTMGGPGRPFSDPRGNAVDDPFESRAVPPAGMEPDRVGRIGGGVALAQGALNGELKAHQIETDASHHYTLDLEVNDDGRRRAFLRTFDIFDGPGADKQTLSPAHGYIDPDDGQLHLYDARYRYPANFDHGTPHVAYKGEPAK